MAAHIEVLTLDSSSKIFLQLYPFWSGWEDVFKIQNFEDVIHFPNLRKISMEYSEERKKLEPFFRTKNIDIAYL